MKYRLLFGFLLSVIYRPLCVADETPDSISKFVSFIKRASSWLGETFDSYDEDYIYDSGKKWKATVKSDNWFDAYSMNFKHQLPIYIISDLYCNATFSISFMGIGASYSLDLSNIIGGRPALHKKMNIGFTCQRLEASAYYAENTGGSIIRRFGDYREGGETYKHFPGITFRSYGADAYYFFNNRRYCQGAVYSFSKIQTRSAGSFMLGFSLSNQNINLNFKELPEELKPYYKLEDHDYVFNYNDYCISGGYGFNCVFGKGFIWNVTALPSFGLKHTLSNCVGGRRNRISVSFNAMTGLAYNNKDFFAGLAITAKGHWFFNSNYRFFNSVETVSLTGGIRF